MIEKLEVIPRSEKQLLKLIEDCAARHEEIQIPFRNGKVLYLQSDGTLFLIDGEGKIKFKNSDGKILTAE